MVSVLCLDAVPTEPPAALKPEERCECERVLLEPFLMIPLQLLEIIQELVGSFRKSVPFAMDYCYLL